VAEVTKRYDKREPKWRPCFFTRIDIHGNLLRFRTHNQASTRRCVAAAARGLSFLGPANPHAKLERIERYGSQLQWIHFPQYVEKLRSVANSIPANK